MSTLSMTNVSFGFEGHDPLFSNITFCLSGGQTAAIIGENGAGKSTLVKLLLGELSPLSGHIHSQGFSFVVLKQEVENSTRKSAGEHQRKLLFQAFREALNAHFLILDEPTNHLDLQTKNELIKLLGQAHDFGVIVISHDRALLEQVDEIYDLNSGGLVKYGGNYEFYKAAIERERVAKRQAYDHALKEQKLLKQKVDELSRRQEKRNTHGQKTRDQVGLPRVLLNRRREKAENSTAKFGKVWEQRVERSAADVAVARDAVQANRLFDFQIENYVPPAVPKNLIVGQNIKFAFSENKPFLWSTPLNFSVRTGMRVAIKGQNGAGKSTLFRLIEGTLQPTIGSLLRGFKSPYWFEQVDLLVDDHTLLEKLLQGNLEATAVQHARLMLGHFGFRGDTVFRQTSTLSGGERTRFRLAQMFLQSSSSDILFLDEPTNHLDIETVEMFEEALVALRKAIVVISHDEIFLENIRIDSVVMLENA